MTAFDPIALRDPLPLAQALIRRPSVTPADEGALAVLGAALESLGFVCTRIPLGEGAERVENLFARRGTAAPFLLYAGHTDVVPTGEADAWRFPPFEARVEDGQLWGRGAADMKGGIACFVAALARWGAEEPGSIGLLITGDEEGAAMNGTRRLVPWLEARDERPDHCLVGEPTNPATLGQMVKIGRRGSLNCILRVIGTQGHVAYPDRAQNPIPPLLAMIEALTARKLDDGNDHFQPSNLEVVSVDVGNRATNVIPGAAEARFNIRFNTEHSGAELERWIGETVRGIARDRGVAVELDAHISGEAFVSAESPLTQSLVAAIEGVTGHRPDLSTSGGTSDARFLKDLCPVAEFGLVGATMHKLDERVAVADLETLTQIYEGVLSNYFGAA
jgi:succinyl-diaminopimelate desuccinylase